MRKIVSRLTATNNDMLGILSSKVRLEESFKTLETANRNLMQVRYIRNENGSHRPIDVRKRLKNMPNFKYFITLYYRSSKKKSDKI